MTGPGRDTAAPANRCRCRRRHRTYETLAKCLWPRAAWVYGDGPYALLAHCDVLTVTLWDDRAEAEAERRVLDATFCGHACRRDHEIMRLEGAQ